MTDKNVTIAGAQELVVLLERAKKACPAFVGFYEDLIEPSTKGLLIHNVLEVIYHGGQGLTVYGNIKFRYTSDRNKFNSHNFKTRVRKVVDYLLANYGDYIQNTDFGHDGTDQYSNEVVSYRWSTISSKKVQDYNKRIEEIERMIQANPPKGNYILVDNQTYDKLFEEGFLTEPTKKPKKAKKKNDRRKSTKVTTKRTNK